MLERLGLAGGARRDSFALQSVSGLKARGPNKLRVRVGGSEFTFSRKHSVDWQLFQQLLAEKQFIVSESRLSDERIDKLRRSLRQRDSL